MASARRFAWTGVEGFAGKPPALGSPEGAGGPPEAAASEAMAVGGVAAMVSKGAPLPQWEILFPNVAVTLVLPVTKQNLSQRCSPLY